MSKEIQIKRKRSKFLSKDQKIAAARDLKNGMSKVEVMSKYDISATSVSRIAIDFNLNLKKDKYDEINEKMVSKIINDAKNGYSIIEMAKNNNVSTYTIKNIINKYNNDEDDYPNIQENNNSADGALETEISNFGISKINKVPKNNALSCQLISGEGDFATKRYILYGPLPNRIMCDINTIKNAITKFITKFVLDENGKAINDLRVYVNNTYNSPAVATLIMVCQEMRINLTLVYLGFEDYVEQPIFTNFIKTDFPICFNKIIDDHGDGLYVYGKNDMYKSISFSVNFSCDKKEYIIFTDTYENVIKIYCTFMNNAKRFNINKLLMHKVVFDNGFYKFDEEIMSTCITKL